MRSLFDENGKYIGIEKEDYTLTDQDIKDIEKAEQRKSKAEYALNKEIKHQEVLYQKSLNKKSLKGKFEDVSGITARKEKYKDKTIIENLGYRKEDKGKETKLDKTMNKYFTANQRIGIYAAFIVIVAILVILKYAGIV